VFLEYQKQVFMTNFDDSDEFEVYEEFDAEFEDEHFFTCPYCWQEISVLLDLSVSEQSYVEDCEVCCRPICISYAAEGFQLISFAADILE
jgi:hypothetical protein